MKPSLRGRWDADAVIALADLNYGGDVMAVAAYNLPPSVYPECFWTGNSKRNKVWSRRPPRRKRRAEASLVARYLNRWEAQLWKVSAE